MTVVVLLLAVVVALLAVLVAGLLRTNAEIMRILDRLGEGLDEDPVATPTAIRRAGAQPASGARTGRRAADLTGATPDGGTQVVRVAEVPHDTLVLFLSSGCTACRDFWDALRAPGGLGLPDGARVVVVTKDLEQESPSALAELIGPATVLHSTAAWVDHRVPGSPYAVLVDGPSGRVVGEGTGTSWTQVATLMAQATGDLAWAGESTPRARKAGRDMALERDTDDELLAAGIRPGDPSLYPGQDTSDGPRAT